MNLSSSLKLLAYSSVLSQTQLNPAEDFNLSQNISKKGSNIKFPKFKFPQIKFKRESLAILLVLLLVAAGFYLGRISSNSQNAQTLGSFDQRAQAPQIKATQALNKEFAFPVKNEKGIEVSKLKYIIESADLQDAIIIKGQKATAVKGKRFLVLNLKITNEHNLPISINSRDYIRLTAGNSKDLLAADIHNDPVQIQPISTKLTRISYPVSDSENNLNILVGEINGEKQTVKLNLKTT